MKVIYKNRLSFLLCVLSPLLSPFLPHSRFVLGYCTSHSSNPGTRFLIIATPLPNFHNQLAVDAPLPESFPLTSTALCAAKRRRMESPTHAKEQEVAPTIRVDLPLDSASDPGEPKLDITVKCSNVAFQAVLLLS